MIKATITNALILICLFILVSLCIQIDILYFHNNIGENSLTETMQLIMLLFTIYSFFQIGKQRPELRHAAWLMGAFYLVLFIRENDSLFDKIYHGAWVIPALIVTLIAIIFAYRGGKETIKEITLILSSRNMNGVIVPTLMLLVFSRLYGMHNLWQSLLEGAYARIIKNVFEESIELLCYTLLAYGAIQVYRELVRYSKQEKIQQHLELIERKND